MRVKKDRVLRVLRGSPLPTCLFTGQGLKQMTITDSGDQVELQFNHESEVSSLISVKNLENA